MDQTTFGVLMLSGMLVFFSTVAVWADWPNVKQKAQKLIRSH